MLAGLLLLVACQQNKKDVTRLVGVHLDQANNALWEDIRIQYQVHLNSIHDPQFAEVAAMRDSAIRIGYEKTLAVDDAMRMLSKKIAQWGDGDNKQVSRLLQQEGASIYSMLEYWYTYIDSLLPICPLPPEDPLVVQAGQRMKAIRNKAVARFNAGEDSVATVPIGAKQWQRLYFDGASPEMANAMMGKLRHDLLITEYELVSYMVTWQLNTYLKNSSTEAVVLSDKAVLRAGDSLVIKAALVSFFQKDTRKVTIPGDTVSVRQDGCRIAQFAAAGNPGQYSLPVRMLYKEVWWHKEWRPFVRLLTYTIVP